ncbi:MAG: GH3 auxin-responsive promoter family protein [Gemmataceae bacterium]|nr:GH3 auxin-responsive promoter family protein [Gemmataceae bacterium]
MLTGLLSFYPIRKLVGLPIRRAMARFDAATRQPRAVQEALLHGIISRHAHTAFGRDHGFSEIHTVADFRRRLPISRYEYFEPYLARVRRGELDALLSEPVVHMFAMTSGTTAARKYIPVTSQYLTDYRRGWNLWGLKTMQDHPEARLRPILQLCGDWDEFRTEAQIPCGSLTGLTAHTQKRIIRWLYCVPACTGRVKEAAAKYYVALRLSMARKVGMVIAANPSTLVQLARACDLEKESLLRDIHDGTLSSKIDVPEEVRAALAHRLRPEPKQARELEAIARRTGTLYPRDCWGKFVIGTWTGGSVGAYLRHFPRCFGDATVRDIGLLASEGRMTIPLADGTPSGVLDVTSHYFEFIPEDEIDQPKPTVLAAHEVQEGRRYFILPTTAYGLYRYNIYDLVQVTGFRNGTPLVEFLSKGSHFASITGEKLSEYQVTKAMVQISQEMNLSLSAYSVAPCWDDERPYYGLFVENGELTGPEQAQRLIAALERHLVQENSEYAAKRHSQRLDPLRLALLAPGTWQLWDQQRLAKTGGTLEQYKHPCLIGDLKFRDGVTIEQELRSETEAAAGPIKV